jgi:hypothetical protein
VARPGGDLIYKSMIVEASIDNGKIIPNNSISFEKK